MDDVIDGVVASKIAAHAADIANGVPGAMDWDNEISDQEYVERIRDIRSPDYAHPGS